MAFPKIYIYYYYYYLKINIYLKRGAKRNTLYHLLKHIRPITKAWLLGAQEEKYRCVNYLFCSIYFVSIQAMKAILKSPPISVVPYTVKVKYWSV